MATETGILPAERALSPSRQAGEIAGRQFGGIARPQLLAIGLSSSRVGRWVAEGHLFPRYPGVYAYGRPDLPMEGDLACGLLYSGTGSALTGLTELWWLGYLHRSPDLIHIDARGDRRSRQNLRIHHPANILRREVRGLPVAALPRALLLSTDDLSHDTLRLVLARADYDKRLSLPSLQSAISDGPRGARALRAAMDAHLPQLARCANPFERSFVLLCERCRLEIPEPNVRIGRYVPDMLWRAHRLIVELDGKDAHSTPAQLIADADRQAHLESVGFTVIRFTWAEVMFKPEWVAAEVRSYLA